LSQLFDSLRRRRQPIFAPPTTVRHTAHRDSVLATLGYTRSQESGWVYRVANVAVVVGLAVVLFAAWNMYSESGAVTPVVRPAAGTSGKTPPGPQVRTAPTAPLPFPQPRAPIASQPPSLTRATAPPAIEPSPPPTGPVQGHGRTAPVPPPAPPVQPAPAVSGERKPAAPLAEAPVTRMDSRAPRGTAGRAVAPAITSRPPAQLPAGTLELALYYQRAGDFENALLQYRALLQASELNAQAHNNLGLLYQEKNLLDDSARELERALIVDPNYARARNNYGVTLLRQGKLDAAAAQFRTVLQLEPRNVDALVNLALVEKAAGQTEPAKESLLRALTVAPKNAAAHYNLAVLYDDTGDASRASEHYRAFLDTAGAEYADRAPGVRARLAALAR
jgi:Tfp pilus assembly protein PilF